jgi:hypothetical protein
MHHPFVPDYAGMGMLVLDFLASSCIIQARGEEYAKTWLYSRYDGCEGTDPVCDVTGELSCQQPGDL